MKQNLSAERFSNLNVCFIFKSTSFQQLMDQDLKMSVKQLLATAKQNENQMNEIQTENQNGNIKTVLLPSSWNRVSDIVSLMITFYDGLCWSML